jgi:hypothetical protein
MQAAGHKARYKHADGHIHAHDQREHRRICLAAVVAFKRRTQHEIPDEHEAEDVEELNSLNNDEPVEIDSTSQIEA